MAHQHRTEYEFKEDRFPNWKGDQWCKSCNYKLFSRESTRLEMFGLVRSTPSPHSKEKDKGNADSAMFRISNLEVK